MAPAPALRSPPTRMNSRQGKIRKEVKKMGPSSKKIRTRGRRSKKGAPREPLEVTTTGTGTFKTKRMAVSRGNDQSLSRPPLEPPVPALGGVGIEEQIKVEQDVPDIPKVNDFDHIEIDGKDQCSVVVKVEASEDQEPEPTFYYHCFSLIPPTDLYPSEQEWNRDTIEQPLHDYVAKCLSKGVDARATYRYYFLVNYVITELVHRNLVPHNGRHMDRSWRQLDEKMKHSIEKNLPEEAKQKIVREANDKSIASPPVPVTLQQKKKHSMVATLTTRLQECVQYLVLQLARLPLKDLKARTCFFRTWCYHIPEQYGVPYLDHFFRALLYRKPEYYVSSPKAGIPAAKNFEMPAIMGTYLDQCIAAGVNPITTHKFYWSVYYCLESGWLEPPSPLQKDFFWAEWNAVAVEAFTLKKSYFDAFSNLELEQYFKDVDELPPQPNANGNSVCIQPWRSHFSGKRMGVQKFCDRMAEKVKKYLAAGGLTKETIAEDWATRKLFFFEYLYEIPVGVTEEMIDKYWKMLFENVP